MLKRALYLTSENNTISQNEKYEYIVVGSGAGGGPLAARLALAGKSVLLVEAGDDQGQNQNQQIPTFHAYATEDESMAWDFYVRLPISTLDFWGIEKNSPVI
jgi:choline dehydrogenase